MSPKGLQKLLSIWQKRLRLQDWNVRVQYANIDDLNGAFALTNKSHSYKEALVRIAHPNQIGQDRLADRNVEVTIVHELLHLHASGFDSKIDDHSPEMDYLETMIEMAALALVGGYKR